MPLSKRFYIAVVAIFFALIFVLILSLRDNAETLSANAFEGAMQQNQFEKLWVEDDYLYGKTNSGLYKTLLMQIQPQVLTTIALQKGQGKVLSWIVLGVIFVFAFVVSFIIFGRSVFGGLLGGTFGGFFGEIDGNRHNYYDKKNMKTPKGGTLHDSDSRLAKPSSANNAGNNRFSNSFSSKSFSDSSSSGDLIEPLHSHIKFSDVAGISEAKEELLEILDFLKHPAKYSALGISLPKGVLLSGAPGVGKTLIAKALAGESGVPFFYQSGASFVEMYVGVGAKRVRELFSAAKASAPCIVFIDEIDAIGKKRTSDSHNSERESTLNQLLVEMDGFSESSGVIVLGATNHIEALDSALLRSGRFDRKVFIELPNFAERTEILKMYLKSKKSHIDPVQIAKKTSSFSGAMLATLVNEAALNTARRGGTQIEERDFEAVYGKISSGKRRLPFLDEKAQKIYALYQASKIIFALKTSLPLQKATLFEVSLLELNAHTIGTNELLRRIYFSLIGSVALWEHCGEGFGVGGEDFKRACELVEFGSKNGLFASPSKNLGGLFGTKEANEDFDILEQKSIYRGDISSTEFVAEAVQKLLKSKNLSEFLQKNMTEILLAGGALLAYERLDWHGVESISTSSGASGAINEAQDTTNPTKEGSSTNGAEFVISAFAPTVLTPFNALSKDYFNESKDTPPQTLPAQNDEAKEANNDTKESKESSDSKAPPPNELESQKEQNINTQAKDTQAKLAKESRQEQEHFIVQNAEILADFIGIKFK